MQKMFEKYLVDNHINSSVVLHDFKDSGRGLMATRDFHSNENIICIPNSILLTKQRVVELLAHLNLINVPEFTVLVLFIYHHFNIKEIPEFSIYLSTLPKSFSSMPLNYPPELKNLLPKSLQKGITNQHDKIKSIKQTISNILDQEINEFELIHAFMCVNTRCISLTSTEICLSPLFDMLNHSHYAKTTIKYDPVLKCLNVLNGDDLIKRGDQVFIKYGEHDNEFLALEYGFVSIGNPFCLVNFDCMFDELKIPGEDSSFVSNVYNLLENSGLLHDYAISREGVDLRLKWAMMLRVCTVSSDFKKDLKQWKKVIVGEIEDLGIEKHKSVNNFLHKMIKEAVYEYQASLRRLNEMRFAGYEAVIVRQLLIEALDVIANP